MRFGVIGHCKWLINTVDINEQNIIIPAVIKQI